MNVVDSSAWVEYFLDGPNAGRFAAAVEDTAELVVPTIAVHEVFKWGLREKGEEAALRLSSVMRQGSLVAIDEETAMAAARFSLEYGLAMADSLILAVARARDAALWTQDEDFADVPGVRYIAKSEKPA